MMVLYELDQEKARPTYAALEYKHEMEREWNEEMSSEYGEGY